ncbi:MAG: aminotransferase class I/II-fold pyridoxal phosphate-dependent enzyme [Balneolaceae bacterium]
MDPFDFPRIKKLPPYIFSITDDLKRQALEAGEDIVDMSMGNPDQPTPEPIVQKLIESAQEGVNHRYSASRGIADLRSAISEWYSNRYDVSLDPARETVVTMGSKEGLAHMVLGMIDKGDFVLCPDPAYPIHAYAVTIAGGELVRFPLQPGDDFFENMTKAWHSCPVKPKLLMLNFPHNPTTEVVDHEFFEKVVTFAREKRMLVVHDLAYADLCFDGYQAPSLLEIPGAKEIGVETFTLSKSYNMPGWRVGFCAGNEKIIEGLIRIKSYLDYGMFQPIQIAAIEALTGSQHVVNEICDEYEKRRDQLVASLNEIGWQVEKPKATMFVWARIPEPYQKMGSLEFAKLLLKEAKIAVSPGIGFGEGGDQFVRFALIERAERMKQGVEGIRKMMLELV